MVAVPILSLRDGNEVDFLAMIDGRPVLLAEVKTGDDTFAKAFWRFGRYFPKTLKVQIVLDLKRPKEKEGISMVPAHEFLAGLTLT